MLQNGASAVILANKTKKNSITYDGFQQASQTKNTRFHIFGKPTCKPQRRMGVALAYGSQEVQELISKAKSVADCIKVI